jgi:hypothetical protein
LSLTKESIEIMLNHGIKKSTNYKEVIPMKRFLITFISVLTFLAFSTFMVSWPNHLALAIDRAPKEGGAEKKDQPAELKEYEKIEVKEGKAERIVPPENKSQKTKKQEAGEIREKVPEKLPERLQSTEIQKANEKYDYFIDKNNNGIDDRQERKSKETTSPRAIRPAPQEKQPIKPAPSTKNTGEKEKTRETPKEKEVKRERK